MTSLPKMPISEHFFRQLTVPMQSAKVGQVAVIMNPVPFNERTSEQIGRYPGGILARGNGVVGGCKGA